MHHAHLCRCASGATDVDYPEDGFTSQALDERRIRAKKAHAASLLATVVGGFIVFKLAKSFVRSVR